jgi:hypothetical protein
MLRVFNPNPLLLKADAITGKVFLEGNRVGFINFAQPFEIKKTGFTTLRIPVILDTSSVLGSATDTLLNLLQAVTGKPQTSQKPRNMVIKGAVFADSVSYPFNVVVPLTVS